MKKGKFDGCWRPLLGVVTVGALALGVSALAAPRPVDDSAVRGTNKGKTEVTRLVTGNPAHLQSVVAAYPTTAILAITPVPAKVGSYPAGTSIVGNQMNADAGGFRVFLDYQVSNWDPNNDNDPQLKSYQIQVDAAGFMGAVAVPPNVGVNLAYPLILDPAGDYASCVAAFGDSWAVSEATNAPCTAAGVPFACCTGLATGTCVLCKPSFTDSTGMGRPDMWCAPSGGGCAAGDCDTSTGNNRCMSVSNRGQGHEDQDGTCVGGSRAGQGCNVLPAVCTGGACTGPKLPTYYGGSMVLDIPAGAKGKYTVNLMTEVGTFMVDTQSPSVDIPTLEENGFAVNIVTGSCCHDLGTVDAGCTDNLLRSECETAENAPYFWAAGDACDAPPGPEGCRQCLIVGRNTDPMCDDGDECTDDDCTPIFTCLHPLIAGFDPLTECCDTSNAAQTTINDGDVCTCDSCSLPFSRGIALHPPCTGPCNDGNPCTTPDECDGIHSEADGGCKGTDVNAITCPPECPDDPLGVPYPCIDGKCFCTLTPKATFVLRALPAKSPMCVGGSNAGFPCKDNGDCPLGTCDQFADALGANCFDSGDNGEKVTALVHLGASGGPINGGQLLMTYDPTCLDYNNAVCLTPYTLTVYGPIVNEVAGTIFIVCGVDPFAGLDGPLGNVDMVSLNFTKIGECNNCELCFANNNPQNSYLVDDDGYKVDIEPQCKELAAKGDLVLDVPDNIKVNSDCDGPTAVVTWDDPTATFSCGTATLTCRGAFENGLVWGLTCEDGLRAGLPCGIPVNCPGGTCVNKVMNGGEFPQGFSSFCCYAAADDKCDQHVGCLGRANDCARDPSGKPIGCWTVEVTDQTSLDIHIELEPVIAHVGQLERCIEFCMYGNCAEEPICIQETVAFGGLFNFIGKVGDTVKIPKGKWACITAQDQLHSLRSSDYPLCIDGVLMASFKGDPDLGGNWLIGGNLDGWKKLNPLEDPSLDVIDILDFGKFVSQFDVCYEDRAYGCHEGPHADINGDGCVTMADYNFVIRNFMVSAKDLCCGPTAASLPGPLSEVSVSEYPDMAVADLNGDGLVNAQDMDAFMQGARPTKTSNDRGGKGLRSGR
ncbi:MAG: dockerin type I domain-containing protein [Planctomycetota bacterium]